MSLGPLETQVMGVLWDHSAASVRETITALSSDHAYTTIATVLTHLEAKGLVEKLLDGRAKRYQATLSREEHCASIMRAALAGGVDRAAAIDCFVDQLNGADLDYLWDALTRRRAASLASSP